MSSNPKLTPLSSLPRRTTETRVGSGSTAGTLSRDSHATRRAADDLSGLAHQQPAGRPSVACDRAARDLPRTESRAGDPYRTIERRWLHLSASSLLCQGSIAISGFLNGIEESVKAVDDTGIGGCYRSWDLAKGSQNGLERGGLRWQGGVRKVVASIWGMRRRSGGSWPVGSERENGPEVTLSS